MSWYQIPSKFLIIKNRVQLVEIEGRSFCLLFNEGEWVAFSSRCPHAGALLANGWCEEGFVICPLHRQGFDLKTGRGKPHQNNYVNIYAIKSEGEKYFIYLKLSLWRRLFK